MVLTIVAVALRPFLRYTLVVDAHNEAVQPFLNNSWPFVQISNWLLRKADRTIVTNSALAAVVSSLGGEPIVLPDPLPQIEGPPKVARRDAFTVTVIATFARDEPLDEVLQAAAMVGQDVRFFITGDFRRASTSLLKKVGPNVELTGFLADHEYWSLLASSSAVMDLTTMDNCLVCGAYEAIAVGTPSILSDNPASRETFAGFGEFTANEASAIVAALNRLRSRYDGLVVNIPQVRASYAERWRAMAGAVLSERDVLTPVGGNRRKWP